MFGVSAPLTQPSSLQNFSQSSIVATNLSQSEQSSTRFAKNATPKPQLWERIVVRLPAKSPEEWYSLKEIAPHLGLKPRSLAKHARDLWPRWEGHYRLDHAQAASLIRRVCYAGKKVPCD